MQEELEIQIHQVLFGYDSGHRLLSSSISLDKSATSTALVLSDLSGQGATPPRQGYLTGYPLPSIGMYALTRTWLATEMPRPGCVWTHALLIDFSDLAVLDDLCLLSLFRRPQAINPGSNYSTPIILKLTENTTQDIHILQHRNNASLIEAAAPLSHLMEAIYNFPSEDIFVYPGNIEVEELTILMWLQQWPRLRRNFRFCTWSGSDRSQHSNRFDLQFVPYSKSQIFRNRNNSVMWVDLTDPKTLDTEWREAVLDVLGGSRYSQIRKFMWRYGAESEGGRSLYRPLIQLYHALEENHQVDMNRVVDCFKELNPPITSLLSRVISTIVNGVLDETGVSTATVEFIADNLGKISPTEGNWDEVADKIALLILRVIPDRIWPLFVSKEPIERMVAAAATKIMKPGDLLAGINGDGNLLAAILQYYPEFAELPDVWDAPSPIPQMTSWILSNQEATAPRYVMTAMLKAENPDVPEIGTAMFGQLAIEVAIENYDKGEIELSKARRWLSVVYYQQVHISAALANVNICNTRTLELVSQYIIYNHKSISDKTDEWAGLLRSLAPQANDLSFHLCSFLMARALSGISPEPLVLLHYSFERVHSGLMKNCYNESSWFLLEKELPEVSIWDRWDRALRVRLAIIMFFSKLHLGSNELFNTIPVNDSITKKLFFDTARNSSIQAISSFFPENHASESKEKRRKGFFW
jgi:hypothetical protein